MFQRYSLALAAGLFLLGGHAVADMIYTGPFMGPGGMTGWLGDDVWYAQVTESNNQGDAPLFGAPTSVTGNSIDFDPQNFNAQADSTGGFAQEIVDSQLSFMVIAREGQVINNFRLTERGDTTIAALPDSLLTGTSVTTNVFIDINEVDGNPVSLNVPSKVLTFTPSGGDYNNNDDGGQPYDQVGLPTVFATDWEGVLDVDIDAELSALGVDAQFGVTKITVTFDNTLTAVATNGESSFIAKKDTDGVTVTTNIPEPGTLALLALASSGALLTRRV